MFTDDGVCVAHEIDTVDKDYTVKEQNMVVKNNKKMVDCDQGITINGEMAIETQLGGNKGQDSCEEDSSPCVNMSTDNSKDDSELSDYSEENTTCQLANQAIRSKLLTSVVNAANGKDSKLRVSVFDHKVIPKRFIIPKKVDDRTCSGNGNSGEIKSQSLRPQNLNTSAFTSSDMDNRRKLSSLSYTALKSGKIYCSDSAKSPPTSPGMDAENDVRTRFDILLRKLIGDVNDMQMETTTTPATVSSGYESDYPTNRGVDINKSNSGSKSSVKAENDKENVSLSANEHNERLNGYISENHNASRFVSGSLQGSHGFSSLPSFPVLQTSSSTGSLKRCDSKEATFPRQTEATDSQGFSYAQRHNYKLTKVTRNMYEIIHDLQSGDKCATDNRKRSRKGRKSSQDTGSNYQSENGLCTSNGKDVRFRTRVQSDNNMLFDKENIGHLSGPNNGDSVPQSFSGSVVRCVRRPLGPESYPIQRQTSHSDGSSRLNGSANNNNSNKVQNDLRNLLCGSSDVTLSTSDNNIHTREPNTVSGGNNTLRESSSTSDRFNQADTSLTNESSITMTRRPTLTQQFRNRSKPDDHVYETIPGDEKLYEEWKKLRQNTKVPKIRRFTTIPDLPGTFIPKEPPALPERKYLNNNNPNTQLKDRDSYIFMGDVNSNFPGKVNLNSTQKDSGYTSLASDKMLDSKLFQCYPYPAADDTGLCHTGRSDETSDGYCSIDNLSLLRENIIDIPPLPEQHLRDRRLPHPVSCPKLPHQKNDYFLNPMSIEEFREFQNSQELLRNEIPKVLGRQHSRDDDVGISFKAEPTKPAFQATYV